MKKKISAKKNLDRIATALLVSTLGATGAAFAYDAGGGLAVNDTAVAIGYLAPANGNDSTAIGTIAIADKDESTALGYYAQARGEKASAIGAQTTAAGLDATALGFASSAIGDNSLALQGGYAEGNYSTAIGVLSVTNGDHSTAIGTTALADSEKANALGYMAQATGKSSNAIGTEAVASGSNATAMGTNATASGSNSIALGTLSSASTDNSVAIGANAVTGAAHTGITAQSVTLRGNTYTYAGVASDANGTVSVGAAGAERQIQNVAAGDVSAVSTDAVNGSQLYATNQAIETIEGNTRNLENRVTTLGSTLRNLDDRVDKVGAGAAALAALHPLDFDPADKWDFAVGYGNYRSQSAIAMGVFYRPNENTMFSIGTEFGNGENMMNAGLSLKLGAGSGMNTSKSALIQEVRDLKTENKALTAKVDELAAQVQQLMQK
jgi:autotransporter adhesin